MRLDLDRLVRRGSRGTRPPAIGYHCSNKPVQGAFRGLIRHTYDDRWRLLVDALPFALRDRLVEEYGLDIFDAPEDEDYGDDEVPWMRQHDTFGGRVIDALNAMQVRLIWVCERPLSDQDGDRRSAYGDWCYRVRLSTESFLGAFVDQGIATGASDAAGFGVLYQDQVLLEEIEDPRRTKRIDFPFEATVG